MEQSIEEIALILLTIQTHNIPPIGYDLRKKVHTLCEVLGFQSQSESIENELKSMTINDMSYPFGVYSKGIG